MKCSCLRNGAVWGFNINVLIVDSKRMNGNPRGSVVVVVVIIEKETIGRMFSVSVNLDSRDTQTLFLMMLKRVETGNGERPS